MNIFFPPRKNKKRKAIDAFRLSKPINKPLNQVLAAYEARRTKDTTDEVSEQQMIVERFIIFVCSFLWNRLIIACTGFFVNTFLRESIFCRNEKERANQHQISYSRWLPKMLWVRLTFCSEPFLSYARAASISPALCRALSVM